jgi:hypothetical protein
LPVRSILVGPEQVGGEAERNCSTSVNHRRDFKILEEGVPQVF